ncbi:MAG: hypothetical protein QG552_3667, partial [Thermodesulfobacteriota bacterium]|nr:hypothetical protein [Thermodesulfobacteriota bacterium]
MGNHPKGLVALWLIYLALALLLACATGRATTDQVDEKKRAKALQEMGNALVMKGDLRAGLG